MTEHDPFRVMCDMWGVERAIKKAKEFGIPIRQEVIDEQERKKKAFDDSWKALIDAKKQGVSGDASAD